MTTIISLEGITGAGKTTQITILKSFLGQKAYSVPELSTIEPLASAIRTWKEHALQRRNISFKREEIENLAVARAETLSLALDLSKPYNLLDRGVYTSVAYEFGVISLAEVVKINHERGVVFPDKCFVLDCDIDTALKRVDLRRKELGIYKERSVHETIEEMKKRRKAYQDLVEKFSEIVLINANKTSQEVHENIKRYL